MRCLTWFREHDLRCNDNHALYHACKMATQGVIAVFIITPNDWRLHDIAACRVDFILRNLRCLSQELMRLHIPLLILTATSSAEIPQLLLQTAQAHQINSLFFNEQYELDESRRDQKVAAFFKKYKLTVASYTDQVILKPGEVRTASKTFYTIFTPFKKAWFNRLQELGGFTVFPSPKAQQKLAIQPDAIPEQIAGFISAIPITLWPAGEQYAQQHLQAFIKDKIVDYQINRDFPAMNGTSTLSPYLTSGIISPRQCLQAVQEINNRHLDKGNLGAITWVSELIWREFYKHILVGFPRVCMNRAFKLTTEKLPWQYDTDLFAAWQNGQTGFPIIDAAMRQLKLTGWMHNRLRMIVAMFLSKQLLIDWRWGEKYFMQNLIDGDLAANNGGWQWAASTGTDAVPYFRIFNPVSQSLRFDPYGEFIKHYCPELAHLDTKYLHQPWLLDNAAANRLAYPKPIVDLTMARARALSAFKNL